MASYGVGHWLTKQEYSKLRYRAKKMGADFVQLSCIWHDVSFGHASVSFVFKPLQYKLNVRGSCSIYKGDFETREDVEQYAADMNKALDFVEFLKEFEKTIIN